ncbi:hypothetical protein B9Z19DRAFT_1075472 [Tuber borchii]|uniref:Uncharacterized protein n=1 Tax=Tuber borchii TaxID=42251 RepID=A0A2T7A394_TUBBO|nr:hypothetical protein B9Z19DRAFT_1075472 [Tuber borchii]
MIKRSFFFFFFTLSGSFSFFFPFSEAGWLHFKLPVLILRSTIMMDYFLFGLSFILFFVFVNLLS